LSKKIPIKAQQWSPAHDEIINSPEITRILRELPEESRAQVEKHLRDYVSVLGGVITTMSNFKTAAQQQEDKDG